LGRDLKRGKGYTKMYRRRGIERGVRKGILEKGWEEMENKRMGRDGEERGRKILRRNGMGRDGE
jgi:hypothetical protein